MSSQSPLRVLVVDDELSVRQSLEGFLDDFGFIVVVASSAEEALGMLETNPVDVAIVDLRLPGKSGEAFIIQAHESFPKIYFLIHTGSVDYNLGDDLLRIGMSHDHVFLKPLPDLNVLVDSINKIVRA